MATRHRGLIARNHRQSYCFRFRRKIRLNSYWRLFPSSSTRFINSAIRRTRSACCARAVSDVTAAPPSADMNCRLLMLVAMRPRMSLDDWTIARLSAAVCDAVALCGGKTEPPSHPLADLGR
jgi:hypothetical protein